MTDFNQPSEIAREALRRLAARRLPPTPDNYRALYHEIAGTTAEESFPERGFKTLLGRLPRSNPLQLRFARQLEEAAAARNWSGVGAALDAALAQREAPAWSPLIRDLLQQLERRHSGLTPARKRESLDHILAAGADAEQLYTRLSGLLRAWTQTASGTAPPVEEAVPSLAAEAAEASAPSATAAALAAERTAPAAGIAPISTAAGLAAAPPPAPAAGPGLSAQTRELIAGLLEAAVGLLLVDDAEVSAGGTALAAQLRGAADAPALDAFHRGLQEFVTRLQWTASDQTELKAALLHLLQLIVDNVSELVVDDQWLHGQVAMVSEALAPPLNLRRLDDVEHRLKDVIFKQGALKRGLNDAKERLKSMLASFVDHLAHMTESTSDYHDRIEHCAERIGAAKDISELGDVIEEVMRETRNIQVSTGRTRDELRVMKDRVEESEKEITRLQGELAHTSEMVRHDQLTGTLNRKGLEEALQKEIARAERRAAPLCVALLDVDNFKSLNDSYGHQAGDGALVHLTQVIRDSLRPHDTLARYGGEEFIILLPETALEPAAGVITRLQRELTKRFFLHNNERVLITFSAGVTAMAPGEARDATVARADAAMYEAKRSGKNRVVAVP